MAFFTCFTYNGCALSHNAEMKPTEKEFRKHICKAAIGKWKAVCTYLDINKPTVQRFQEENPNDISEAFFGCLCHWLEGNADELISITWNTLLEALIDAELKQLAEELRRKLLEGSL